MSTIRAFSVPDQIFNVDPADLPGHVVHGLGKHWRQHDADHQKANNSAEEDAIPECEHVDSPPSVKPSIKIRRSAPEPDQRLHDKRRRVGFSAKAVIRNVQMAMAAATTSSPGQSSISEFSNSSEEEA